MKEDD